MRIKSIFVGIISSCLLLTSCGVGNPNAGAGNRNGKGNSLTNPSATGKILGDVLTSLIGNTTTKNSLVGTWKYSAPKVVFESENILAKYGGSVLTNNLESRITNEMTRMGFTTGKTKITFKADNTCVVQIGKRDLNGTYTYNQSNNLLTITDALGVESISCTATVHLGELYLLFNSDKILTLASGLSAMSSSTSTLSSILQNYNGMKVGWVMTK